MFHIHVFYRINIPLHIDDHPSNCKLLYHAYYYLTTLLHIFCHLTKYIYRYRIFCYLSINPHTLSHHSKYKYLNHVFSLRSIILRNLIRLPYKFYYFIFYTKSQLHVHLEDHPSNDLHSELH